MEKSLDEVVEMVYNSKISIRRASQEYGYTRDIISSTLFKKYGRDEKLIEILKEYKDNSTALEVDSELLAEVFEKAMNKEITLTEAREVLGIKDKETLRMKFLEYIGNSDNEEIRNLYKKYMEEHERDYSHINFRVIAIEMIGEGVSQSEMARRLNIPARTISREFEKFKEDEDLTFYNFIKEYNQAVMRKYKFTKYERVMQQFFVNQYEHDNYDELYKESKTKEEERIELENHYMEEEERLKAKGLTQAQIADELGISVSTLRRVKKNVQKRKVLQDEKNNNFNGVEVDDDIRK